MLILLIVLGYVALVLLALSLAAMAKRGDNALAGELDNVRRIEPRKRNAKPQAPDVRAGVR